MCIDNGLDPQLLDRRLWGGLMALLCTIGGPHSPPNTSRRCRNIARLARLDWRNHDRHIGAKPRPALLLLAPSSVFWWACLLPLVLWPEWLWSVMILLVSMLFWSLGLEVDMLWCMYCGEISPSGIFGSVGHSKAQSCTICSTSSIHVAAYVCNARKWWWCQSAVLWEWGVLLVCPQ